MIFIMSTFYKTLFDNDFFGDTGVWIQGFMVAR
jgi:hypothetical protein